MKWITELARKERGAITILVAVGAPAMIGMAAFAVETSNWYMQAAELQRVADAAATAGAIEYVKDNGCNLQAQVVPCYQAAKAYAVVNGVPASSTTVAVISSPTGDGNLAVQVTLTKNIPLILSRVLSSNTSVNLSASAYTEIKSLAPPCVEALSATGTPDVKVTGNVTLTGCSLWAKSNATGSSQSTAAVALTGNSTMAANVYTPGSLYVGGSSAFTGKKYSVTQAAVSDFVGARSAVTSALGSNLTAVQALTGPTVSNPTSNSQTWTGSSGSCSMTVTGPQSYASITISAGTCSPFIVTFVGNITVGNRAGTHNAAMIVTGNVSINFQPATDTFNGYIDLSGQTGGCFGLGSQATPGVTGSCAASSTSGTYSIATGNGSYASISLIQGAGSLVIGPGTFWSGGDVQLTGGGTVSWNPSGTGTDTTKIAGNLSLGTGSYTFGAGAYKVKSSFAFPSSGGCNNTSSSGSLTFNGSATASSLITVGATGNNAGLCLGSTGNSGTYAYSTTSTTFILAQAPTVHATGSGTHSLVAPCTQTAATTCASSLTGSGIAGLLMAIPQSDAETLNLPSDNSGTMTLGGMLYGKAATLNLQGNASNSGCFGFIVSTAVLSGTASFATCSTLQGIALGLALVQ
ncbi:MAG TPA: pilus assembly protein TadG-related protein [Acetobacteraceae bacterium]|nr:pilus assembly protein TadG-related protein [Acetobacteraceae bacterium]